MYIITTISKVVCLIIANQTNYYNKSEIKLNLIASYKTWNNDIKIGGLDFSICQYYYIHCILDHKRC